MKNIAFFISSFLVAGACITAEAAGVLNDWASLLHSTARGITAGPAAATAGSLSGPGLNENYRLKLLSPLIQDFEGKGQTPAGFGQLRAEEQRELLAAAIVSRQSVAEASARSILLDYAHEVADPDRLIEMAGEADDLLLFAHPYLSAEAKNRLIAISPYLQRARESLRDPRAYREARRLARKILEAAPEDNPIEAPAAPTPRVLDITREDYARAHEAFSGLFNVAWQRAKARDLEQWIRVGEILALAHQAEENATWLPRVTERLAGLDFKYYVEETRAKELQDPMSAPAHRAAVSANSAALIEFLDRIGYDAFDPDRPVLPGAQRSERPQIARLQEGLNSMTPFLQVYIKSSGGRFDRIDHFRALIQAEELLNLAAYRDGIPNEILANRLESLGIPSLVMQYLKSYKVSGFWVISPADRQQRIREAKRFLTAIAEP